MENRIDSSVYSEENKDFLKSYFELLINRVTHATMALEKDLGNPDSSKNAIRLRDNMTAFTYLIYVLTNHGSLNEELIIKIADTINRTSQFISNGYRNIGDHIADTQIPISTADAITNDMQRLLYDYQNSWTNMDPYEREARFHIEFIRIHPFEDGNGRTGRLLLNFNMLRQGLAPIIITEEMTDEYHACIKEYDVDTLRELFLNQSLEEGKIISQLFQEYLEYKNHVKKTF